MDGGDMQIVMPVCCQIFDFTGKLDATVFYEYDKFRIGAKVNNLTDKHYILGDYYAELQAPRQFLANLIYRF